MLAGGLGEEGTCATSSHSMFSGLISRCRMEKECRYSRPTTESRIQVRIRGSLIISLRVIGADRSPPATNSMMRYMLLWSGSLMTCKGGGGGGDERWWRWRWHQCRQCGETARGGGHLP